MKFVSKLFTALALVNLTVAVYADDAAVVPATPATDDAAVVPATPGTPATPAAQATQAVTPATPEVKVTTATATPEVPVTPVAPEVTAAPATPEVKVTTATATPEVPAAATKSFYEEAYDKTAGALKAAKDGVVTAKDTVVAKAVEAATYANENRLKVSVATAAVALTVGAIYYVAYQAGKNAEAKRRAKADKQQAAVCYNN
jgi:hypothetical protein